MALGVLLCLSGIGCAGSSAHGARVLWVRGDRVYVAWPDSAAPEPGTALTFRERGKSAASGEITAVHDGALIAAKLTAGSLANAKHLDRIEVVAERPDLRAPTLLRVGYPSPARKNLLFDCSTQSLDPSFLSGAYDAGANDGQTYRFVRDSTDAAAAAWPDTLLVRLFDEVSDEEIALERGDLDVAVFWPGEASTHIRDVMRWEGRPSGLRAAGFLAASAYRPGMEPDSALLRENERQALALMNRQLFRGDLAPMANQNAPAPATSPTRFEVDGSLSGREPMQRFLNQALGAGSMPGAVRIVRLFLDNPREGERKAAPVTHEFGIGCPVLSAPRLRPYLNAIGPDPLANLLRCAPPRRKP
jgi:hypothetical protein